MDSAEPTTKPNTMYDSEQLNQWVKDLDTLKVGVVLAEIERLKDIVDNGNREQQIDAVFKLAVIKSTARDLIDKLEHVIDRTR